MFSNMGLHHLPFFLLMPLAVWGYCEDPYVEVGETCLYFETMGHVTYTEARQLCHSANGELAAVTTPTQFKAMIDYIYATGLDENSFWLDGSDEVEEDHWVSSSGSEISMGTPFWAGYLGTHEPNGGEYENCMDLSGDSYYYLNDDSCSKEYNAICESQSNSLQAIQKLWEGRYATQNETTRPIKPQDHSTEANDCPTFYANVGGKCLAFMNWLDESWNAARQSCNDFHGELATIDDIEVFRALILYIQQEGLTDDDFWLSGSDAAEEGVWKWLNGTAVPMGTPFWGVTTNFAQEPLGSTNENCLCLLAYGYQYFRDTSCSSLYTPLCQYVQ